MRVAGQANYHWLFIIVYLVSPFPPFSQQKIQHSRDRRDHRQDEGHGSPEVPQFPWAFRGAHAEKHGRLQYLLDFGAEDQAKLDFGPDQCLSVGQEEENETIQGCWVRLKLCNSQLQSRIVF